MDVTDIPSATIHSDSDENRHEKPQTSQGLHSQYASEYCNNPLAKREVQTTRPCAIIGPDRIIQQQPKRHSVLWPPTQDDTPYYSVPQNYHHYPAEHLYPPRNISPRQTFQENMPRILVPSGGSSKVNSEVASQVTAPGSFSDEGNVYIPKHFNPSLPQPKYCDVPYVVNPVNEHRQHATKIGDIYVTKSDTLPSMMAPLPPHPNVPARTWQQVPVPQYQGNYPAPGLHRYPDYQQCPPPMYRPVKQGYKKINDDTSPTYISEGVYRNSDLRFQPYPTVKDKYSQSRYDHPYNIPNQFSTNYNTSQRGDYPKTVMRQAVQYPQHLHNRAMDPSADCLHKVSASRHASQTTHHSVPYQMNENITLKHIPGEHMYPVQSKVYGYSGDCSSRYINSVKGFENSKIYLDYNQRVKNIAYGDPFVSDPALATYHKTQAPIYNYPVVNTNGQRAFPPFNVNYKVFENLGNPRHLPEYSVPYKTQDLRPNTYNPLARIPAQFSPNIISPTDSNTSVESTQQVTQEDCGYVSQCSTTSGKSVEYPHKFYSNCDRKANRLMDSKLFVPPAFYNMSPTNRPTPDYSHEHLYHTNHTSTEQNKQSKQVRDLRQFLQMYNPHDEFEELTPNQEPSNCDKPKIDNLVSGNFSTPNSGQNQLYVLDLVNVSSDELQKYDHIQKVNKLPDNIKGYNNVELLNQFEEALGTTESRDTFEADKLPNISAVTDNKGINIISHNTLNYNCTRPISPLDVEAKISQSIIHKEVGCNFEIKPCSPVQNSTLPILSSVPKFEDGSASDIFNMHHSQDSTPEEYSQVHVDTKSKLREKRRYKIGNTSAPSKRPKSTPVHDHNTNEIAVLNPHKPNDSNKVKPECQSSLPRLDSDIDIARNMTIQNENDVMTDCSGATFVESHTRIQYNDDQFKASSLIYANTNKNEIIVGKETIKPPFVYVANDSPIASPLNSMKIEEKNSSKLSKYRKVKKNDSPLPEMPIPSRNTIDYCSNSPLNLEFVPEIRENKDLSNEVLSNLNSNEFSPRGSVNSVINSITDGKIESVTYSHTNNRFNQDLHNKNHESLKNIDSPQSSYVESHCGTLLESSSSQISSSEESHSLKKNSSCDIAEHFNSNIQDIDVKLCSIQLKDNNNVESSEYESKSFNDAFDNPFTANIGQSNIDTQHPQRFFTKDDEIENNAIEKIGQVSKREIKSTPKEINNILVENDVITNGFTKEADIDIKIKNVIQKNNCEDSLPVEYDDKSSSNPTELTTLLDLSANQEISQPEENNLKDEYNPPHNHKVDKTIDSVSLESTTEISKKILSQEVLIEDPRRKNNLDSKNLKASKDIECNTLIEVSDIKINAIHETDDTFLPNSTEPIPLIIPPSNLEISESEEHNSYIFKDIPGDNKRIEKSISSEKNHHIVEVSSKSVDDNSVKLSTESECKIISHSDHFNTTEDNESNAFIDGAESDLNSACKTDDTHSMKSEELSKLSDVNEKITHSEKKDLNISEDSDIDNTIIFENNHHSVVVLSTDTILKNEKLLSRTHTPIKVADTDINSVCEADKTLSSKSEALNPLLDLSVHQEMIHSEGEDFDNFKNNNKNDRNVIKIILSEESHHKVEGSSQGTTLTSENLLSTESEGKSCLSSENSNSIEINFICETDNSLSPKSKKQSIILDSSVNHEMSHFIDNILDISKDNPDHNENFEKTMISEEIDSKIAVPLKSMTDKYEESLNMESECENISPLEHLNSSKLVESSTPMEVADTVMNSVCETEDTSSSKSDEVSRLLDSPVDQEMLHTKQKHLEISKHYSNHSCDVNETIISREIDHRVVVASKNKTEINEKVLSPKSVCTNTPDLNNFKSTDIDGDTQIQVADTEVHCVSNKDHTFLQKSSELTSVKALPINQAMARYEEKERIDFSEDNANDRGKIDKTMISNEIPNQSSFTLESMSDNSKKSHFENPNVSEDVESSKLESTNTNINSICKTDYKFLPESKELSPILDSTVNQEISHSEWKKCENISNNCDNKFKTIPFEENYHGVVVCLKRASSLNNLDINQIKVSKKSEDIDNRLAEVADSEINCVNETYKKKTESNKKSPHIHKCKHIENDMDNIISTTRENDLTESSEEDTDSFAVIFDDEKYASGAKTIFNINANEPLVIEQSEKRQTDDSIISNTSTDLLLDYDCEKKSKLTDCNNVTKEDPKLFTKNDVSAGSFAMPESNKSMENNDCAASELNLFHEDLSVSEDFRFEADEQIYVKHSDVSPLEGIENISCSISASKLVENYDSPLPEELNADKDGSALNHNTDISKEAIEDIEVPSLLENEDDSISKESTYEKIDSQPINVDVALEETIENNSKKNISFEKNYTSIPKYSSHFRQDIGEDTIIFVKASDTSKETIDCNSNCNSSDPVSLDENNRLKCNNNKNYGISVGINLASCESTNNNNCDKMQMHVTTQKCPFSSELTFVEGENDSMPLRKLNYEKGNNNYRNKTSTETVGTNHCNNILPISVENYNSPISNEFKNVKDEMIDVRVNLTSNKTTINCSAIYSDVVVEKNNFTTLMESNYDEGQNIEVSKFFTERNNHDDSNTREVEKCNALEELDKKVPESVHMEGNSSCNETSENTECIPVPVLVKNYDCPESLNYNKYEKNHVSLNELIFDKSDTVSIGAKVRSDQILLEKYHSQMTTKLSFDDVENISVGENVASDETNENIFLNTKLVLVESYDSQKSNCTNVNEYMQSDTIVSKEIIETTNNCGIEEEKCRSSPSRAKGNNSNSIEINDDMTSNTNDIQLNFSKNKDLEDENGKAEESLEGKYTMVFVHPTEEKVINIGVNVDKVNDEIFEEAISNSSSQFCFENNQYDVNHTYHMIPAENLNNDLLFRKVDTKHIKTHSEDLPAPRDDSMFLGYDCEDFMRAGVITVKDEQCCVVLERNGKIYSERGNSIEDVLCNMIPCSPLSDSDEHTQDYELVSCQSYDNIPDDGVTESIDNYSGVDIQISSSEGDENANNITLTHKVASLREASMCESDSEESSQYNADYKDPCLQGVDDSPVLLELPTAMNENNFVESSNFENTNIGIQYEDCWINDVACIETVVSEDVSDMTQEESLEYDECSSDSKEQEKELQSMNHEESSILIADVVEKEVKSLYVRIKLVSQIDTEKSNKEDSSLTNKDKQSIISDYSSSTTDGTDNIKEEIPVKEKYVSIKRDNEVSNVKNHTPDKPKSSKASKYSPTYKVDKDKIDIEVKNYEKALVYNNFTDKSAHTPAARGRVVSNVSYNYNTDTTQGESRLITKAAKKYIPPIVDSQHNFKVQLPLSKENLLRLKILKLKFDEATAKPKMRWQASFSQAASTSLVKTPTNTTIPKKSRPKFEDVLKKIDHIQINSLSKSQSKKDDLDPSVPKVIIKKNEYGSHYTANIKKRRARSPDLTGRRWQPWVHLERNRLVEKMVSKNKFCAVFCHSANKYIISRRPHQENKDSSIPEIVVSRPLKCTIKLNTDNGLNCAVLAPAHVSAHTSHSSLHHSKPILTISNYKKKNKKE